MWLHFLQAFLWCSLFEFCLINQWFHLIIWFWSLRCHVLPSIHFVDLSRILFECHSSTSYSIGPLHLFCTLHCFAVKWHLLSCKILIKTLSFILFFPYSCCFHWEGALYRVLLSSFFRCLSWSLPYSLPRYRWWNSQIPTLLETSLIWS